MASTKVNIDDPAEVVVTLTGALADRRVTVNLNGVNGVSSLFSASVGFLVGDINRARSVNATDISALKASLNRPVGSLNFVLDIDGSGTIDNADVAVIKARSGRALAP